MYKTRTMGRLIGAALTFSLLAAGCSTEPAQSSVTQDESAQTTPADNGRPGFSGNAAQTAVSTELPEYEALSRETDTSAIFTDRDLSGSYDSITAEILLNGDGVMIDGSGASADGSVITITDEGTYRISGTLTDGRVIVSSEGKVQLLLAGADITCSDSAPIYIENAKKAFVTTEAGTDNFLTDGSIYTYAAEGENEPDAALFSKDSLTLNGSGSLHVTGNYNEGITGKDDVVITSGSIYVQSVGNGIKGKDYVAVAGGEITIDAGGDGLKSNNETDAGMGFVYVQDGTLTINAAEDGVQADNELLIDGGSINVMSGGGIENAVPHTEDFGGMGGGRGGWGGFFEEDTASTETEDTTISTKALKAGSLLEISGGAHRLEAADDALHSNSNLSVTGGTIEIAAGSDGIHADARADLSGGSITITQSYEGIEAAVIRCMGAAIDLTSSDDGFNASDGTSQGAMGTYSDGCCLVISDGTVYVDASGDGLDSNGLFFVTGGTILVDGPENSGNGALDTNSSIICTGGELIAAGMSGMAEYPESSNTLVMTLDNVQTAGTLFTVFGDDGSEISYAPAKTYNSVVIRSDKLQPGVHYTVYLGGTNTAEEIYGLYAAGGYQNDGTETGSFDMTEETAFIGEAGGMMGGWQQGGDFHGGGGFHGGRGDWQQDGEVPEMPEGGMTPPDGEVPEMPEGGMTPPDGEIPGDGFVPDNQGNYV